MLPRKMSLLNVWFLVQNARLLDISLCLCLRAYAQARAVGVDLIVLDDGWFGRRDDDTTSLGG